MGEMVHLQEDLKRLGLHTMAAIIDHEVGAIKSQASYTAFRQRLVEEELVAKTDRSVNARIAKARFPAIRTLEAFDFGFQPQLAVAQVKELAGLDFLDRAENLCAVGPPGTGKTHLLIGLAMKACQARKRVLFTHAPALLDTLEACTIGVTTNKPFDQWGQVFGGDEVIAAAILDRLLHHSHILTTTGPSYRMKDKGPGLQPTTYGDDANG